MELYVWLLELIFVAVMLAVGWVRQKGLWFMFGMFIGAWSLLELSTNNLTLTNGCTAITQYVTETMTSTSAAYAITSVDSILNKTYWGWDNSTITSTPVFAASQTCVPFQVALSSFMYFIPLILIIMNFASIVALRKQLGRGAV